ncbi:MAG: hypothetical protein AAFX93_08455 [Verrucomicrobiota bacterium]
MKNLLRTATAAIAIFCTNIALAQLPTVDLGNDLFVELPDDSVYLDAVPTGDSLDGLTIDWSLVNGSPVSISPEPSNPAQAIVTFTEVGSYTIQFTASDDLGNSVSDTINITLSWPVVEVEQGDQTFTDLPFNDIYLSARIGTLEDDQGQGGFNEPINYNSTGVQWILVEGPGEAIFTPSEQDAADGDIVLTEVGTYQLALELSFGSQIYTVPHTVYLNWPIVEVEQGASSAITLPENSIYLSARVSDLEDHLVPGESVNYGDMTVAWLKTSGPGDVTVTPSMLDSADAELEFSAAGEYVVSLDLAFGSLVFSTPHDVTVNPEPGFTDGDDDGYEDSIEIALGTDPNDPNDNPEWVQIDKLRAIDANISDNYGFRSAISDNYVLIGANKSDVLGTDSGQAYLYDFNTGELLFQLVGDNTDSTDQFGSSVALTDQYAVVGAMRADGDSFLTGAAYVFDVQTGQQLHRLTASDAGYQDYFGNAVAINGDTIIVGARLSDSMGAAYVFSASTGQEIAKLVSSDIADDDRFGQAVAISDSYALVGAHRDDDNGSRSGSAYLFETDTWQETHKLTAPDGAAEDFFGFSVAVTEEYAAIGAFRDRDDPNNSGSAYVFETETGTFAYKLRADDTQRVTNFGIAVAASDNFLLVGSNYWLGQVFVYTLHDGRKLEKLMATDAQSSDKFGRSLGIQGTRVVVGSHEDDDDGHSSGSAYLYNLEKYINQDPTDIILDTTNQSQDLTTNTFIGHLSTIDPDAGESFYYTLISGAGGSGNRYFMVPGPNYDELHISPLFDLNNLSDYSIRVITTDSKGGTFEKTFTITF